MSITITGLAHLEGKEVEVKADGKYLGTATVDSGEITIDTPTTPDSYTAVVVGLPYRTLITTLNKEYTIGMGTMQGQKTRYPKPILRLYNSAIPTLNETFLPQRYGSDLMDTKVDILGMRDIMYGPISWSNSGQLRIYLDKPYPLRVLGIFGSVEGGVT